MKENAVKRYAEFKIGHKIYVVGGLHCSYPKIHEPCGICHSTGEVKISGKTFTCPECGGKMTYDHERARYRYEMPAKTPMEIGRVEEVRRKGETKVKVSYMTYETGVGSGRVYAQEDCFFLYEEAVRETKRRNAEFIAEEIKKHGRELTEEECK